MKQSIIIVSGPTACGKTDLVYQLASQLPVEIINADIGSMYKPLTIGTAKPDWQGSTIKHHMFDILDQPEQFCIVQFRASVQKLILQIWHRGNIPVIVGGSTMYIKSLFLTTHDIPDTKPATEILYQRLASKQITVDDLWQQLYAQDSKRANKIHKNDKYRIVQALAILHTTKQQPSQFEQYFNPIAPFYWISCTRDRAELYQRINQRVCEMMDQGFIQEVAALQHSAWQEFLMKKKIIGYDDIFLYLAESGKICDLLAIIQQKTRHYAKRQMIFFKKLEKDVSRDLLKHQSFGYVHDLNLTLCDVGLYIKGLSNQILQNLK